uniref:Glycosyltransferase 2-like domain-containing protein n=1 Tax=viral metagenome TaxID=1070528 RepID=A0A6C0I0T5_9ZZZZ
MNIQTQNIKSLTWFCSVYKADDYIVDFINDFLNQTNCKNINLLLINICNSHVNPEFVNKYINNIIKFNKNINCINMAKDPGLYQCWNYAIKEIKTKYITNANLDDRHHPEFSNVFTNFLDNNPDCSVAISPCFVSKTYEKEYTGTDKEVWFMKNLGDEIFIRDMYDEINNNSMNYPHACPVWRRELHSKLGYFNSKEYGKIADYQFWLHLLKNGYKIKVVSNFPFYLYYYNYNSYGNIDNYQTKSLINKIKRNYYKIP